MSIQIYHCDFQYQSGLKVERQCRCTDGAVIDHAFIYQDRCHVDFFKYRSRDTSESS
jgi:hypothetical protein